MLDVKNLTSQDVQRYVRLGLQWTASALMTYGLVSPNATWVQPTIAALVGLSSLAWTIYGNRIQAKIDETMQIINNPETPTATKIAVTNAVAAMPETQKVVSTLGSEPTTVSNVVTK